jgi:21S rRNA (uridine2791-2'-O)-methyltransferase
MQAPWTRTPLRLAVPVTRGLSCLNSTTKTTFKSPLLASSHLLPAHAPKSSKPPTPFPHPTLTQIRPASSSSGSWKIRQGADPYTRSARVQGLKSRAAFKLFEMDIKYGLFRRGAGQVVVDLGYAPGSWSQVAVDRTAPNGTVLGIDIIPAQPPKGVSTIQGNFLNPRVREMVKQVLVEGDRKRRAERAERRVERRERERGVVDGEEGEGGGDEVPDRPSYIDLERMAAHESDAEIGSSSPVPPSSSSSPSPDEKAQPEEESAQSEEESTQPNEGSTQPKKEEKPNLRLVDVVLSDMSAPWPQTYGFMVKTLSNPYNRMMNTSGIFFKDHAGSMDLCYAALTFASETLKPGGHFVCKFYQGAEDKALEDKLKQMFKSVHREKPDASRKVSLFFSFLCFLFFPGFSLSLVRVCL